MRTPSAAELLSVWENGLHQGPIQRALSLLEAFWPKQPREAFAHLSIGERDAHLFQIRQLLFGPRISSMTSCPRCSEQLEWESEVAELCCHRRKLASEAEFSLEAEGYDIKFRLPTSADVSAILPDTDPGAARERLLERCILGISASCGEAVEFGRLSETARLAIEAEMDRLDPQSNLRLSLSCPVCAHRWQALFDIVSFLWTRSSTTGRYAP